MSQINGPEVHKKLAKTMFGCPVTWLPGFSLPEILTNCQTLGGRTVSLQLQSHLNELQFLQFTVYTLIYCSPWGWDIELREYNVSGEDYEEQDGTQEGELQIVLLWIILWRFSQGLHKLLCFSSLSYLININGTHFLYISLIVPYSGYLLKGLAWSYPVGRTQCWALNFFLT